MARDFVHGTCVKCGKVEWSNPHIGILKHSKGIAYILLRMTNTLDTVFQNGLAFIGKQVRFIDHDIAVRWENDNVVFSIKRYTREAPTIFSVRGKNV